MTPCIQVKANGHFEEKYPLRLQSQKVIQVGNQHKTGSKQHFFFLIIPPRPLLDSLFSSLFFFSLVYVSFPSFLFIVFLRFPLFCLFTLISFTSKSYSSIWFSTFSFSVFLFSPFSSSFLSSISNTILLFLNRR